MSGLYTRLLRPLLFRLPADTAHDLAQRILRTRGAAPLLGSRRRFSDPRLATNIAGIHLSSPVGLAPGFDKDAALIPSLQHLGFGYLVVGSVTREPRDGNPRPRLVRYPDRLSIGNSMGLPNKGLRAAVDSLRSLPTSKVPVIVSVAGFTAEELLEAATAVEPHVAGVEIGLICPNTTESERMEELGLFTELATELAKRKRKPIFVKLPPYHDPSDRDHVLRMVDVCMEVGLDGVSLNGGRQVQEPRLASGAASIAGRPTFDDSLRIVRDVAEHTEGRLPIKASGGVFSGDHAAAMLRAGATSVELYSSLIYRGLRVADHINRELAALLRREGLSTVDELRNSWIEGVVGDATGS